ncbi:MAG: SpoIIE family protein phosphatase [Ignavibacteria bacterium]|nr:SpoIIE family protein phosphatase [Ignavibacteria bacterium]
MKTPSPVPGVGSSTAFHLASLLDLNTRLTDADPVDVLNVAVLSVMGRLKIQRACFLLPNGSGWSADPRLCKGVLPFSITTLTTHGIEPLTESNSSHKSLIDAGYRTIVPIGNPTDPVAIMLLGRTLDNIEADREVSAYLEIVRGIVSTTVQNAKLIRSLISATKELEARNLMVTTLFESARDFTLSKTKEEMLRILSYRLMGQLMVSTFGIFFTEPLDGIDFIGNRKEAQPLADLRNAIISIDVPLRIDELPMSDPLRNAAESMGIAIAVPMTVHGVKKGVIATRGKLNGRRFTDEEMSFLESLGNTAMIAVENERLIQEEILKRRLENELKIAADIQRKLLPDVLPHANHLEIAADARTSRQIGGDYYDVISLDDNRTLFAIADVAGKGIPAALLMANVQAALNVLVRIDMPLTHLMSRLNSLICDNTEVDVFVTMFICVIDSATLLFEYVNAGHNPPILLSGKEVQLLSTGGVLTGVIEDPPEYKLGTGMLDVGDVLLLYTDGVTEARNHNDEYGVPALVNLLMAKRNHTPSEIIRFIHRDIHTFTGTDQIDDDTSLVAIKVI